MATRDIKICSYPTRGSYISIYRHNAATHLDLEYVVTGYIEFAGEIVKISSVEDIERVLKKIKAEDKV